MKALASWAVLAICLFQDMLWGVIIGVTAFQLHAAFAAAPKEKKA